MHIYNTYTRKIEKLVPLYPPRVTFYACGPTVYDYTHIGHMRKYTMDDVLKRVLTYLGHEVYHVMNITDVGHLTGDDDTGEDKFEKGARKTGKSVWDVAIAYTDYFHKTIETINIIPPHIECKATDHIKAMIELIQRLEENGYTYETDEAIYFDTTKFSSYGKLSRQDLKEKKQAARNDVHVDAGKKNPVDFALWIKRVGRFATHTMHWDSPWGDGFPGWHIECSAMSMQYLGEQIDIHSGGVDHLPVHHENEIAQSECATGKHPFVNIWVHHEFLTINGEKMSKSLGNFYTIDDVRKKHIDPLALRLLFLQTHYRQQMNFTWESAQAAHEALRRLRGIASKLPSAATKDDFSPQAQEYNRRFASAIGNDLQVAQAVAVMWEMLKSNIFDNEKAALLHTYDTVFGLDLFNLPKDEGEAIPEAIQQLVHERQQARNNKDFARADAIRDELIHKGYVIEDGTDGVTITRR